jgi:hypothetical protein
MGSSGGRRALRGQGPAAGAGGGDGPVTTTTLIGGVLPTQVEVGTVAGRGMYSRVRGANAPPKKLKNNYYVQFFTIYTPLTTQFHAPQDEFYAHTSQMHCLDFALALPLSPA